MFYLNSMATQNSRLYIFARYLKTNVQILKLVYLNIPFIQCNRDVGPWHGVRSLCHGYRIDPSWWNHSANSRSSQCSTTGMCYPVCRTVHIKDPLLLIGKCNPCSGGSGFLLLLSEWFYTMSDGIKP